MDIGLECAHKDINKRQLVADINTLNEYFSAKNHEIIDMDSGLRILNGDTKHLWFRDNIAFYFATGRIFDDSDKQLLTAILSYFNNSKRTYLGNFYKVLSYNDPVIQGFERKLNIGNGNYHFIMIIIAYPLEEDIKYAPNTKFMNRGVVEYFADTYKIKQRMIEIIREYGLVAELETSFESIEPTTVSNSFTHRDIQFDIRDTIDTEQMSKYLQTPQRTRQFPVYHNDTRNVVPLNKRIQPTGSNVLSIPIPYRAIYSRMTDTLQIDENQHTYQLYGNDDDYIQKIMP